MKGNSRRRGVTSSRVLDTIAAIGILAGCGLVVRWTVFPSRSATPAEATQPVAVRGRPIDAPPAPPPAKPPTPAADPSPEPNPVAPDPTPAPAPPAAAGEFPEVTWDTLAGFSYSPPRLDKDGKCISGKLDSIPAEIKQLDGKPFKVAGYMMIVEMDGDYVKEFLLVRAPYSCCYGTPPQAHEMMSVRMEDGTDPVEPEYRQIQVSGTLSVGEEFTDGFLMGVYRMKGKKIEVP